MKRYRHYNKNTAIILSCFGSIIEEQKYLEFEKYIKEEFPEIDVYLSFSSRMVIKLLAKKKKKFYKNLPQLMADVDMAGYKRYIVASINIFPTDEHEALIRVVHGFQNFSLANIRYTNTLLSKTKETSKYLKNLDETLRQGNQKIINLYIVHGVPVLHLGGIEAVSYTSEFLKRINPHNISCSLEGEFPFYAIKEAIKREILEIIAKDSTITVQIVPMLLISGNHYDKDMQEIKDEISEYCSVKIVDSLDATNKFNLLGQTEVKEIFKRNIAVEIKKLG